VRCQIILQKKPRKKLWKKSPAGCSAVCCISAKRTPRDRETGGAYTTLRVRRFPVRARVIPPSLLFFVSVDAPANESPFSSAVRASDDAKGLMAHRLESLGTVESKRVTG
jgi:hypothetical protein